MSSFEHLPEDWSDRLVQAPLMAAEIRRLEREVAALREALAPFAQLSPYTAPRDISTAQWIADVHRAYAALIPAEPLEGETP